METRSLLRAYSIATIMDNITDNGTTVQGFLSQTVFLAYNSTLLVIMFPVVILNCVILATLLRPSSLPSAVRSILGALTVAEMFNAFGLIMQRLVGIILKFTLLPSPDHWVCRFILWMILTGAASRLTFLALFVISLLVIVIAMPKRAKPVVFGVVFTTAFLIVCAICGLVFAPNLTDVQYEYDVSCGPLSIGMPTIAFAIFYVLAFGFVPFCITILIPIVALCYLKRKTITDDIKIKKALARFALFGIVGNVFNFIGIMMPAAITALRTAFSFSMKEEIVKYVPYALMSLSLLSSPILMLIFFKAVRDGFRRFFCCCCRKEKVHFKDSKTARISNRTKGAKLSL